MFINNERDTKGDKSKTQKTFILKLVTAGSTIHSPGPFKLKLKENFKIRTDVIAPTTAQILK